MSSRIAFVDITNRRHINPGRENEPKPWKWILADSLIIGGIAAVASMPSAVPTVEQGIVMLKAFALAFLTQVAIERGLKQGEG